MGLLKLHQKDGFCAESGERAYGTLPGGNLSLGKRGEVLS